jgi:prolyl oligopeptidase
MRFSLGLTAALLCPIIGAWAQRPPQTRTDNVKETIHGTIVIDPYRWLEDQKSAETRAWIDAQNRYTRSLLDHVPVRKAVEARLSALMKIDTTGIPAERGGRYFFSRRLANQDLSSICMRKSLDGPDEVLIDPHSLSTDHTISVNMVDVSNDGTLVAYALRQGGEDEITVRLLNVDTRKELPDQLPKARYFGLSLKPDRSGLYYTRHGKEGSRVFYHAMGTPMASDREIFGQGYGPDKGIGSELSEDGRHLLITVWYGSAADKTEVWLQDVARNAPVVPVVNDITARFSASFAGTNLVLNTNWQAPNGRVFTAPLARPARAQWREIVPQNGKAVIEGLTTAGGRIFVEYLEDVKSRVAVFQPDGRHIRDIAFPAIGTVSSVSGRWESNQVFYGFSSFHIPSTIYRYDAASGQQQTWYRVQVPVKSEDFELKQVWYNSKDGTRVPMFMLHRKGIKLDGAIPVFLTGYGGFTASETPGFNSTAVLWAERGGVFALPNLRGGGEFGENWHKAGMLDKKQNVFDDFYAAAEWLIKNGYTRPSRIAISGVSNGGLLVGASLTQRPDLFGAVVCGYPLLDMIRYQQFSIARFWVPEYGSSENAQQFQWLRAYSPYHNVKKGAKYPAVLFVTGDSDTRVDPLHARKMAALLQASTGSGRPVMLLYDTKSGHSGGRPVSKQIEEKTDELSFLLSQVGR